MSTYVNSLRADIGNIERASFQNHSRNPTQLVFSQVHTTDVFVVLVEDVNVCVRVLPVSGQDQVAGRIDRNPGRFVQVINVTEKKS